VDKRVQRAAQGSIDVEASRADDLEEPLGREVALRQKGVIHETTHSHRVYAWPRVRYG
jgi:hypothetical protein